MFGKLRPTVLGCQNTKVENENILICFENLLTKFYALVLFPANVGGGELLVMHLQP